uniref:Small subunit processome component 20 homolog n=1 Tax=Cacopsylla melanoneura TaxID=428564 RepID=A0A8D8Y000_9HEMI
MKPKPLRKKEGKTFTFQPFSERITNLNVDIFHRVGHKNEEIDNERETFFYQTIVKWNGLNTSESYNQLCKELTHHVKILPQVIAQKDKLVETLKKYLHLRNEFSLEPTLELIVALAKDLTHQEFFEFFPQIFPLVISLLYCKDYDQIEWAFQCLAYLFKILWKQLVQDIDNVLGLLLPLLHNTQPLYIVNFSAQSFAYVARKIKNRKQFIHLILKALKKSPEGEDGCGTLLFETIKGVSGKLHSCTHSFLTDVVSCLGEQSLDTQCLTRVVSSCLNLIITELEPEQCTIVWTVLHKKLSEFLTAWTADQTSHVEQFLLNILCLMNVMAGYKRGVSITQPKPLIDLVIRMVQDKSLSDPVLAEVVVLAAALQRSPEVKISQEYACQLAYNVLRISQRHLYLDFIERVFSCAGFNTLVLPSLLNFCESASPESDLLQLLTKLILHKVPSIALGSHFDEWRRIALDFTNKKQNRLLSHMTSILSSPHPPSSPDDLVCTILICPHVNAPAPLLSKLHDALKRKVRSHEVNSDEDQTSLYVYTLLVEAVLRIDPGEVKVERVLEVLGSSLNEVCALRTIDLCLSVLDVDVATLDKTLTADLKTLCVNNLCSPYSQIRTLSSHILTLLSPLHSDTESTLFELIHQAETTETNLQSYRDKLNLIHKLESYPSSIALKYMFGVLYVNFSLLWKPVCGNIVALAESMEVKEYWGEYHRMLSELKHAENREPSFISSDLSFVTEHYSALTSFTDKPDHANVRVLLWETLTQMKTLIGQKNRDLAALFLDFVNGEFRRSDAEIARVWDITVHQGEEEGEEEDEEQEEEVEEEEGEDEEDEEEENYLVKRYSSSIQPIS